MHDDRQRQREWISALVDGQLEQGTFTHAVAWIERSDEALATWHAYHVVGDVLRCPDLADCGRDQAFLERFRVHLDRNGPEEAQAGTAGLHGAREQDAVPLVPVGSVTTVVAPQSGVHVANDAVARWRWIAVAASVMAVVVLGWHVGTVNTMQLAAASDNPGQALASTAATGAETPVMLRDARLDELLAAHRQFGGTSALQMPAGFLRNATFDTPARR